MYYIYTFKILTLTPYAGFGQFIVTPKIVYYLPHNAAKMIGF
jgi:hypothetical protein